MALLSVLLCLMTTTAALQTVDVNVQKTELPSSRKQKRKPWVRSTVRSRWPCEASMSQSGSKWLFASQNCFGNKCCFKARTLVYKNSASSDTPYRMVFIRFPPSSFDLVVKGGIWLCCPFTHLAKISETWGKFCPKFQNESRWRISSTTEMYIIKVPFLFFFSCHLAIIQMKNLERRPIYILKKTAV